LPSGPDLRVTPTAASAASVTIAVAASEGEDLGKKGNKRVKPHTKKNRKWDKPRFPNTPVGTFGWWGGAAWSCSPLGPGH
jgi:hypothetical protein